MSAKPIAWICDCKGTKKNVYVQKNKKNGEVCSTSPLDRIVIACEQNSQAIIYNYFTCWPITLKILLPFKINT